MLADVPEQSVAARDGLKKGDLIQSVDGMPVSDVEQLLKAISNGKSELLKLKVVRSQQTIELPVEPDSTVVIESASTPSGFTKLPVPAASGRTVTANREISNDPLKILTDGKLAGGYGPLFPNSVYNGAYKMDLDAVKPVTAITSWSLKMSNTRVGQKLTIYGSRRRRIPDGI